MYLRVSEVKVTVLLLLLTTPLASSYPFGAPACVSSPRHGPAPQSSKLDLHLEKNLTEYGDVRLQLGHHQSDFTFRGFLVKTEAPGRKWLAVMIPSLTSGVQESSWWRRTVRPQLGWSALVSWDLLGRKPRRWLTAPPVRKTYCRFSSCRTLARSWCHSLISLFYRTILHFGLISVLDMYVFIYHKQWYNTINKVYHIPR